MTDYEQELAAVGIRLTAVRLLIWRTIRERKEGAAAGQAFSLSDLQDTLYTVDKSTLFRALTLFAENGLLHLIDDGSGMQKYCMGASPAHPEDAEHHGAGHIHLTCTVCHRTWCVEDVQIPSVPVPDDFEVMETEYVIKGVCRKCRSGWR